jgi:toxin ParE1/3/4
VAKPELILRPEATQDIQQARDWYNGQSANLGEEFPDEVDQSLERIREYPDSAAKVYRDYRRVLVHRFPYVIMYESDGALIQVFAILHSARDATI